jgi:hypothetical protein
MACRVLTKQIVPFTKIVPLPAFRVDAETLNEYRVEALAKSIRDLGLMMPVILGQVEDRPDVFYILTGYARVEACKRCEMVGIPANVWVFSDAVEMYAYFQIHLVLQENMKRTTPHPRCNECGETAAFMDDDSEKPSIVYVCKKHEGMFGAHKPLSQEG